MTRIVFYEKPGCANNARQKKLLLAAGHEVFEKNLLTEPWTASRLREFFGARPVAEWFNRAAPRVKNGEIFPETMNEAAALRAMVEDPLLIRRPLLEAGEIRLAGFDSPQVARWLGDNTAASDDDLAQACHRQRPCPSPAAEAMSTAADIVLAYHERTKHHLQRYAAGPETLDWSMQPDPFRSFAGAPRIALPFTADGLATRYAQLAPAESVSPQAPGLDALGALLELSLGLSAWKEYGPDRWALRCNPSSGNLHPTEGYVLSRGMPGLADGVYHYLSREHCLEQRLALPASSPPPGLYVALSSVHWREAWKYGERAFRYCQLDTGHALGALRYAAAALGWKATLAAPQSPATLGAWLGLDRAEDYAGVESEEPELLLALQPAAVGDPPAWVPGPAPAGVWAGRPNRLDPHPMYQWPVIDEVAAASRPPSTPPDAGPLPACPPREEICTEAAADILRRRRSAQRFDPGGSMESTAFFHLLDALLARATVPWDVWAYAPRVHPLLFVHRVVGWRPASTPYRAARTENASCAPR